MINIFNLVNKPINTICSLDNTLSIICKGVEYAIEPEYNRNIKSIIVVNGIFTPSRKNILQHVEYYIHYKELVIELIFENSKTRILIEYEKQPKNYDINLVKIGQTLILENNKFSEYDNSVRNNLIYKFLNYQLAKFNFLMGKRIKVSSNESNKYITILTSNNERYLLTASNGRYGSMRMNRINVDEFTRPITSIHKCIHKDKIDILLVSYKLIIEITISYKKINSFKINIEEGFNLLEGEI